MLKMGGDEEKVIRKTLLMNAAREQLFLYMEQEKIWHLPLKGAVLSSLYPQFGMRQIPQMHGK